MAEVNQGLVDLHALKRDIEDYPNKLRAALLRVLELEERNTSLQKEIKSLEGNDPSSSTNRPPRVIYRSPYIEALHNDPELNRMKQEMGHLRTKTMAAIATNPSAYGLGTRPAQKIIEAVVNQDKEVEALQRQIETRQALLQQQIEQQGDENPYDAVTLQKLEQKRKELSELQKSWREAKMECTVIEALPLTYDLLVRLAIWEKDR